MEGLFYPSLLGIVELFDSEIPTTKLLVNISRPLVHARGRQAYCKNYFISIENL